MNSMLGRFLLAVGIGLVTALVAALLGGWLADAAANWYRIPGMEGQSGYFVLFMVLFAIMAGFAIGFGVAIFLTRRPGGGVRALWIAPLLVVVCIGVIGVTARLLADVPPRLQGDTLLLHVELSWPVGEAPVLPAPGQGREFFIELGSLSGQSVRLIEAGPIWTDRARHEDGRLVVPATVEVFTSRGKRLLLVHLGSDEVHGFLVPLPAFPRAADTGWSQWLPSARSGTTPLPDGLRYRFRVARRSEPLYSETVGPFTVHTVAQGFSVSRASGSTGVEVYGHFLVYHRDQAVAAPIRSARTGDGGSVDTLHTHAVAWVASDPPALVVQAQPPWSGGGTLLLRDNDGELQVLPMGSMHTDLIAFPLAGASDRPHAVSRNGRVNRSLFEQPGLYIVAQSLLDTRGAILSALPDEAIGEALDRLPPLSLAPDESRFARMRVRGGEVRLVEVDLGSGVTQDVAVRHAHVPTGEPADADVSWFRHYFDWDCAAGSHCRVTEKADARPLPRRGGRSGEGSYRGYRLQPAAAGLQEAVAGFLVEEMAGRRLEPGGGNTGRVRVEGAVIQLSYSDEERRLTLWTSEAGQTEVLDRIGDRIDEALREGRFEAQFLRAQRSDSHPP